MEIDPYFSVHKKINFRQATDLNLKDKHLFEENMGKYLYKLREFLKVEILQTIEEKLMFFTLKLKTFAYWKFPQKSEKMR